MQNVLQRRLTHGQACLTIHLCFYKKGNTVQWRIWEFWYSFPCNLGCDEVCVWSQQAKTKCHLHSWSSVKVSALVLTLQTTELFQLSVPIFHYSNICVQLHKHSISAVASSPHPKKHVSNHSPASYSKVVNAMVSLGQKVSPALPCWLEFFTWVSSAA